MSDSEGRLADGINSPPVVFMDCTAPQIGMAALVSVPLGMFLGAVIGVLLGFIILGLAIGLIFALVIGWGILYFIQVNKERYYETWLEEQIFLKKGAFLESIGVSSETLIRGTTRYGRGARKK